MDEFTQQGIVSPSLIFKSTFSCFLNFSNSVHLAGPRLRLGCSVPILTSLGGVITVPILSPLGGVTTILILSPLGVVTTIPILSPLGGGSLMDEGSLFGSCGGIGIGHGGSHG